MTLLPAPLVSTPWLAAHCDAPGLVVLDASYHLPAAAREPHVRPGPPRDRPVQQLGPEGRQPLRIGGNCFGIGRDFAGEIFNFGDDVVETQS